MHGWVPSVGFSAIAVTTVSVFMMVAELRKSSQALICSSIMLGSASINILTFIGRGISLYAFGRPIHLATICDPLHLVRTAVIGKSSRSPIVRRDICAFLRTSVRLHRVSSSHLILVWLPPQRPSPDLASIHLASRVMSHCLPTQSAFHEHAVRSLS